MEWHIHPSRWDTVAYIKLYCIIFLCIFDVKNVPRRNVLCAHVMQNTITPPSTVPLKNFNLWVQSTVLLLSEMHEELIITKAGTGNTGWGSATLLDAAVAARLLTWSCSGKGEHGLRRRFANRNTRVCNLPLLTELHVWLVHTSYQGVCSKSRFCLHFLRVSEKKVTRTHYYLHERKKLWKWWISKLNLLYKYILFLRYYFYGHYHIVWSRDWRNVLGFWSPKLCLMALVSVSKSLENVQAMNATQSCCREREPQK